MKGGTIQGSPLSPILFMFLLGGVLEEVGRKKVEGVSMVAVVDDMDFMVVGDSEKEILEKVKKMEIGLRKGLDKWEVDMQVLKLEGLWMDRGGWKRDRGVRWLGEDIRLEEDVRVLGVWWLKDGGWESHVKRRIELAQRRWRMILKLLGRNGQGVRVKVMAGLLNMVVMKVLMYSMELYWNGDVKMLRMLEVWRNRCLRCIVGAVRTIPKKAMLGKLGWKSLGLELDKKVDNWGERLIRRGFGERFGEGWKKEAMDVGVWLMGWEGRVLRGFKKHKLNGERYEVLAERGGNMYWKIFIKGSKEEAKEEWMKKLKGREKDYLIEISDASERSGRMCLGGIIWEYGRRCRSWKCNVGRGLTVGEGEMEGVGRVLRRVLDYNGGLEKLVVGVDNQEERRDMERIWEEEGGRVDDWLDMELVLFSEEGSEGVKEFGRKGSMDLRMKERCDWRNMDLSEEGDGVLWRNVFGESRVLERKEKDKKMKNALRMRIVWKRIREEKKKGRGVTPIASLTPLGVSFKGGNRKELGVIGGNVGKRRG
ncbi:hypothetical protein B9Z19DRAFT_1132704 [Tuber borchii]|uniref:Reverse transcriptase domain-containing protein n=1 Tax=Tuber borchii TaxID=42251 RepID=A0A2T6ZGW3_TUBBO|nr:hypothetical protein B9Z19DRAFT_1132704 [Tuber borchii]